MGRVVTFGEIMLRLSPPGYNRLLQNELLSATFGGAEANVAVSLANFGIPVSFVSKVPLHSVGQGAVDCLRSFGIDISLLIRGGDRLGIYYLEKGSNQRNSLCLYDRAGSAISKAEADEFNWNEIFKDADWFHFTGITPALSDNLVQICKEACIAAKEKGMKVSCDLNYRSKLWSREKAREVMTDICSYVDICIANEEDVKNVFGIETKQNDVDGGKLNIAGYKETAEVLIERFGFELVAFSLRTSYSASRNDWTGIISDGKNVYSARTYHLDHIVDRVGSGDSFAAGIIYGLRSEWDCQKTVDFAVAASALKHSVEGDFNRVSVEEVLTLVNGSGSGRIHR